MDSHLTSIGYGKVLFEPGPAMDPTDSEGEIKETLEFLRKQGASLLYYDMSKVMLIDRVYYKWLCVMHDACRIFGAKMIAVNVRPTAASSLSNILDSDPPFPSAQEIK